MAISTARAPPVAVVAKRAGFTLAGLYLHMLQAAGVPAERFGDAAAPLSLDA